jgi:hypothetical protein
MAALKPTHPCSNSWSLAATPDVRTRASSCRSLAGVGDGPFGLGLEGLGQEAVEVARAEGGKYEFAGG